MGDIIAGILLIILSFGLYGLYRLLTRKKPEKRSFITFISLLIMTGGLIGILFTFLNKTILEYYPVIFGLTLFFFMTQTVVSYLYIKYPKFGLPILLFTFLLQTPIIHSDHVSYSNQTLLSVNIDKFPGKTFDIEPGSYVSFFYGIPHNFSLGINLIPLLTTLIFLRDRKRRNEKSKYYA
jgi:hypothetical protein